MRGIVRHRNQAGDRREVPMRFAFGVVLALTIGIGAYFGSAQAAGSATANGRVHYPSSFAAIGDSWAAPSVTADSWATGTNTTVDSQYLRILAHNPAIRGHDYNLAKAHAATGPGMSDLAFQAAGAIAK